VQYHNRNLRDQEKRLRKLVEERGATVLAVFTHVGSGVHLYWLATAVRLARKTGAILLSETTDRFARHPDYSKNSQDAQARELDLQFLKYITKGVRLMTALDPDALPGEVRSFQTKRGHEAKGKGGRPRNHEPGWMKKRLHELCPHVLKLRENGWSLREIEKETAIPFKTVQRWVCRFLPQVGSKKCDPR
jgi:hypothetical protein